MQYGTHYVDYNGCELIAIYNALFQLGDRRSLSNIIYTARNTKGVSWGPGALFGSHPEKIGDLLDVFGHSYVSTKNRNEFNDMLESGKTYIISFWTGKTGMSTIHTVMFNMISEEEIEVYNYTNGSKRTRNFKAKDGRSALDIMLDENGREIMLYKVNEK